MVYDGRIKRNFVISSTPPLKLKNCQFSGFFALFSLKWICGILGCARKYLKTVFFHSYIGLGNMTKFWKISFSIRVIRVSQKSKKCFFRNTLTLKAYFEKFYYTNPRFAFQILIQYGLPFLKRCITSLRTNSNMCYGRFRKYDQVLKNIIFYKGH